jgi:conjugative relaxase-like TrwC/TraI family protein
LITIHKLTAGDGYTYLTRQVATGDVQWEAGMSAEYYTAKGNPPGRWVGRGAPLLGLGDQMVTEDQMQALYGSGMNPNADEIVAAYLKNHLREGMTERQRQLAIKGAIQAATLGRRYPVYGPIEPFADRVDRRLELIETQTGRPATSADVKQVHAQEARRVRAAVAGYDVVFAPVKSAALLWALDPRAEVRAAVRLAHEAARDAALEMLEEHAAFTRTGTDGVAQIATNGLIASAFDHYDSRGGDPNLHTHVALSNKIQGVDGKWRSLDARALYRLTVAASEFYNTRFEVELAALIAVTFTERSDTQGEREPIREITGIPLEWVEFFSSRRTEIEARYEQLLRTYRREHGRDPSRAVAHKLARQATLDTRDPKKTARSLEEMRTDWAETFTSAFGPRAIGDLMSAVPDVRPAITVKTAEPGLHACLPTSQEIGKLAAQVVANVAEMRSTWTVWNLHAEAERLVRFKLTLTSADEHQAVVGAVVAETISPRLSVRIDRTGLVEEPKMLRRADGSSVFEQHAATRFTSRLVLDAEDRLVAAARTHTIVGLAQSTVTTALDSFDAAMAEQERKDGKGKQEGGTGGRRLDPGQRELVRVFATDERLLVAGLGPAGAGKTTAMRAYAHVAKASGQRIVPLATSAAAAEVLGKELGVKAENLHKFMWEYTQGRHAEHLRGGQRVPEWTRFFALNPGDVVLVDEAGMAGTLMLDRLINVAAERGAVVRLLGDFRQLGAVESGGALRLIATDVGAVQLTTLYRFANPAEAEATLKIRVGDSSGLDFYAANGRIKAGSQQAMIEEAYAGWKTDMLAGKTSLMAAAASVNVTDLSAQARRDRVEAGQVEADGVPLHDGNHAGKGDWIVTRDNNRLLKTRRGQDWVKNGDAWQVIKRHDDGSLTVRHLEHRGRVHLPAEYVAAQVELLYATTTNRAQGSTVDTAHPLVTADMTRENLYVIATRARLRTILHVVTHRLLPFDLDDRLDRVRNDARQYAGREVLENILANEGNEVSATETIRQADDDQRSLATLVPRHQHAATLLATQVYTDLARQLLARPLADRLLACEGWGQSVAALAQAEAAGWPARHLLTALSKDPGLLHADTPGRLLAWRIGQFTADRPAPGPLAKPTLADAARYTELLRHYPQIHAQLHRLDPAQALHPPALLTSRNSVTAYVSSRELTAHADAVAKALNLPVDQIRTHHAWPHLAAALTAAHRAGRDVPALVGPLAAALTPSGQRRTDAQWDHGRGAADQQDAIEQRRVAELSRAVHRLLKADPSTGPISIPRQLQPAHAATAALDPDLSTRLRAEESWPILHNALLRAADAGHDPVAMLRRVTQAREIDSLEQVSPVLAWRLGRYLSTRPVPQPGPEQGLDSGQWQRPATHLYDEWRLLTWTLKGIETTGTDPTAALPASDTAGLPEVLAHARQTALALEGPDGSRQQVLPWLLTAAHGHPSEHELPPYLTEVQRLIGERMTYLTGQVITERPVWAALLGAPPQQTTARAQWEHHVAIVAAYRDQHAVTLDNPRQVLGPYAEPGRPNHSAYWHAVESIVAARRLAGLDQQPATRHNHLAGDLYQSLPEPERRAIHTELVRQRADLWFGDRITLDDHAVTHPAHSRQLAAILIQRGHLDRLQQPPEIAAAQRQADARPVEIVHATQRQARREAEHEQKQTRQAGRKHTRQAQAAPLLQPPPDYTQQYEQRMEY